MTWDGKGSTREWRRVRAEVLDRDGHVCQIRGPRCTGDGATVHHVLGRGVSESPADLVASCWPCNWGEGNPADAGDPQPVTRTRW